MLNPGKAVVTCIVLLLAAVLAACTSFAETGEPLNVDAERPGDAVDLDGTEWALISLNGESLIDGTRITLNFDEGFVSGFAGCNAYRPLVLGEDKSKYMYRATDDGTLMIPGFVITEKDCLTPEGVMRQEAAYVEALEDVAAYRLVNGRLEVANALGETPLVFARRGESSQILSPTATVTAATKLSTTSPVDSVQLPDNCSPQSADLSPYVNVRDGYCLTYPTRFKVGDVFPGIFNLYGPPLDQSLEPLQAGMSIVVRGPAIGRTLGEVVDGVTAEFKDFPITRTQSTLDVEPAEIIEGHGEPWRSRQMFVIHNDTIYSLSVFPVDKAFPQVAPDVDELWQAVISSFAFLP
jgi:heat shock protein HslJ